MDLNNKTAVVTGGGTGIGFAITRAFVDAGAHVIIVNRDAARLDRVREELGNITSIQSDLAVAPDRNRLIHTLLEGDRPLDLLVNNAGVMQYFSLVDPRALGRLDAELALDLHAPIHLSTALLPHLLARPRAAIVNVTTGLIYAPFGNTPGYSAAKAGLHGFTQSLRWQTKDTTLRVVELMPPAVDTELTRRYDGSKTDTASVANALMAGLAAAQTRSVPASQLHSTLCRGSRPALSIAPSIRRPTRRHWTEGWLFPGASANDNVSLAVRERRRQRSHSWRVPSRRGLTMPHPAPRRGSR